MCNFIYLFSSLERLHAVDEGISARQLSSGHKSIEGKRLNPVPPGVKSAEAAELWSFCVGQNVSEHSLECGSAVAAQILRFARRNRQGGFLPSPSASGKERNPPLRDHCALY